MGRQVQIIERFSSIEAQVVESVVVPGVVETNLVSQKVGEGKGKERNNGEREEGIYTAHIRVLASFGECLEEWDVGCC